MTELKPQKNHSFAIIISIVTILISASVGLMFAGSRRAQETQAQTQTESVLNLPAVEEKVDTNTELIRMNEARNQAERNRREKETYEHIDDEILKVMLLMDKNHSALLREFDIRGRRLERDEIMLFDHINSPPARHGD